MVFSWKRKYYLPQWHPGRSCLDSRLCLIRFTSVSGNSNLFPVKIELTTWSLVVAIWDDTNDSLLASVIRTELTTTKKAKNCIFRTGIHDSIYGLFFPNGKWRHNGRFGSFLPPQYIIPSSMFQGSVKISVVVVVLAVVDVISIWLFVVG